MRGLLFLATIAAIFAAAPDAMATKRLTKTHEITLQGKQFHPAFNMTVTSGDLVRLCNRDRFQHKPFSWNASNTFEVTLNPGECHEFRAHNPGDSAMALRIYDQIHSQERLEITILTTHAPLDPSMLPAPRDQEWAVYIEEDGALCCLHDVFDHYPNKRDGELPYDLEIAEIGVIEGRSGVRILRRGFTDDRSAEEWVCGHDVLEGGRWTRNYARVEGVLVGNLPCKANIFRPN